MKSQSYPHICFQIDENRKKNGTKNVITHPLPKVHIPWVVLAGQTARTRIRNQNPRIRS